MTLPRLPIWPVLFAGVASLIFAAGISQGQDADPAPPTPNLDEAFDRALGEEASDRQQPAAEAIPRVMNEASGLLATGHLNEAAARQKEAIEQIDRLLESLQSVSPEPQQHMGAGEAEIAGTGEAGPDEQGQQTGAPGAGAARETVSGNRPGEPNPAVIRRRRSLATSVWGHLPDRYREEMQQGYRERYLPEYEQLVERYYEALARQKLEAPRDKVR